MAPSAWHPLAGNSMWPLTAPLEARVVPVLPQNLQIGDMIAFIAPNRPGLWMHRVVALNADGVLTRGDTNAQPDPPVPWSAIVGRVDALRLGRFVMPLPEKLLPLHRALGQQWSRVAPRLRKAVARRLYP